MRVGWRRRILPPFEALVALENSSDRLQTPGVRIGCVPAQVVPQEDPICRPVKADPSRMP